MTTFKKCLSLILLLSCIFTLTFSSCSKESKKEEIEKATTSYLDWFGLTVDLSTIDKVISPFYDMQAVSFETSIAGLEERGKEYIVVRAKCIGNMKQKMFEDSHYARHFDPNVEISTTPTDHFYVEVPYQILEILEGDASRIKVDDIINVEVLSLCIGKKSLSSLADDSDWVFLYHGAAIHFIYPRIDYEYIVILSYNSATDCYYTLADGGPAYLELSKPEDYCEYRKKILNLPDFNEYTPERLLHHNYYEVLERYNIKIK